jgi:hypothetical protein
MTVCEGGGKRAIRAKFQDVYVPALKANFIVWPAVQMLNFRVMPIQFQIVSTLSRKLATWLTFSISPSYRPSVLPGQPTSLSPTRRKKLRLLRKRCRTTVFFSTTLDLDHIDDHKRGEHRYMSTLRSTLSDYITGRLRIRQLVAYTWRLCFWRTGLHCQIGDICLPYGAGGVFCFCTLPGAA